MTRVIAAVLAVVVAVLAPAPAVAAGAQAPVAAGEQAPAAAGEQAPAGVPATGPYRAPVAGPLIVRRGFDDVGRYEPGHRGVDLQVAPPGTVTAAAAGVVTFAGQVAGRGVVTVLHPDGIRTSYEPLAPAVAAGATVAAGDPLGTVAGAHGAFPAGTVLHWGARRGEAYLDPLDLLAPLGPVRLLPWDDP